MRRCGGDEGERARMQVEVLHRLLLLRSRKLRFANLICLLVELLDFCRTELTVF